MQACFIPISFWARVALTATLAAKAPMWLSAQQSQSRDMDGMAGMPGIDAHAHMGHQMAPSPQEFKQVNRLRLPSSFSGNFVYDPESKRLFLIGFGRPAIPRDSLLIELDAQTGEQLASAPLPFLGGFGPAAFSDGYIYQPITYSSTLYKVDTRPGENFGRIAATLKIPTLSELGFSGRLPTGELLKFPWLEVDGVTATNSGSLILYAAELGEFIYLRAADATLEKRVPTIKGLGGITFFRDSGGHELLLANMDPADAVIKDKTRQFELRSPERLAGKRTRVTLFHRRADDKTVDWMLIDPGSGEPLASVEQPHSEAWATCTALLAGHASPNQTYDTLQFLALSQTAIVTLEWKPVRELTTTY